MNTTKILNIAVPDRAGAASLGRQAAISPITAQVLINRGIRTPAAALEFLSPRLESLHDPFLFSSMGRAVSLIKDAARKREPVLIYSDYDVDGITSLTLLKAMFDKLGVNADYYIPNRIKEGYGLNKNVLELVRQRGIKLLITADCGTNSEEQVRHLRALGIEVIITDHHEPSDDQALVHSSAIINPKMSDSGYPFRELAGVGVAYKVCQAVTESLLEGELDLVCLGTIADAVPLVGENRIIAKEGLMRLSKTSRIGLQALMEASGIKDKQITPGFVSFILGPRINASGRMESAEIALNLLLSRCPREAEDLAKVIERCNRQRQKLESVIMEEAQDLISREINFKEHKVMVVAKEGWHTGVLGIVAAKLAERFYRPTILISMSEQLCKGSGRSIKNFHLFEALLECKELLHGFGGHQHATGLSLTRDNIGLFREKINRFAHEKLTVADLLPSVDIDMELALADLNEKFVAELGRLEPFGIGNKGPLFLTRGLRVKGNPRLLSRDTLKCWLTDGNLTYQAIGFGMGSFRDSIMQARSLDLVYCPKMNSWAGQENLELEVKEIFCH